MVGGLLAVAGGISALTVLYWRRTRPVSYNAALDAAGDLAGPPPITQATTAVVGEPTVVAAEPVTSPAAPARSAEDSAALLAALVAAEGAGAVRPDPAVPADDSDGVAAGEAGDTPGAGAGSEEPAPITPGGAGFRVMGPVAAAGAVAAETSGDGSSTPVDPEQPVEPVGGESVAEEVVAEEVVAEEVVAEEVVAEEVVAGGLADAAVFGDADAPQVSEPFRFVTREDLDAGAIIEPVPDPLTELFEAFDGAAPVAPEEALSLWESDDAESGPGVGGSGDPRV